MPDPIEGSAPDPPAPATAPAPAPKAVSAPVTAPTGKPDAVLCSANYPPGQVGNLRHQKLREEFGPVLGVKMIYSRAADVGHTHTFITGTPNDAQGRGIARFFSRSHPRAGEDRYAWTDRGDGVFYGTLTEEAIADERAGEA
jgi:hypothetical protein